MADRDLRARLDEMAQARRAALHNQARRNAAVALLEQHGSVTADQVDAHLADTLALPSRAALADAMAHKAAAGVEHAEAGVEAADRALQAARAKRDKLAGHLAAAEDAIGVHERAVDDARAAVGAARELADYAATVGEPHTVQAGPPTGAAAQTAQAATESGE